MMIWYIHTQNPYPATMITASTGASTNVRNKNIDSSRFFVGELAVSGMICAVMNPIFDNQLVPFPCAPNK